MSAPAYGHGLPAGWDAEAHALWQAGRRQAAIDAVLSPLNRCGPRKPSPLVLQLAYYIFLAGDPASAADFLARARVVDPDNPEILRNLAVCLSRSRQHAAAVDCWQDYLRLRSDDPLAFDSLCSSYAALRRFDEARAAGTRALQLKDRNVRLPSGARWHLPGATPRQWLASRPGHDVIAFSLWGGELRYLRGALDNALAAAAVYPGWRLRFHVDDTVPADVCTALFETGAELRREASGQDTRQRLAWRFQVANDPAVARFLVRDVDAVVSSREAQAVDTWLASDCWFHVMRDWWTHTDLMLAGMWGGVAGVLPALADMLATYRPPAMETANVDQWFLRDRVWPYVRQSCLVHDRCFDFGAVQRWPGPAPDDRFHVGQDRYAVSRDAQADRLRPRFSGVASLQLS